MSFGAAISKEKNQKMGRKKIGFLESYAIIQGTRQSREPGQLERSRQRSPGQGSPEQVSRKEQQKEPYFRLRTPPPEAARKRIRDPRLGSMANGIRAGTTITSEGIRYSIVADRFLLEWKNCRMGMRRMAGKMVRSV